MSTQETKGISATAWKMFWVSLALLFVGTIGYFTLRGHWSFYGLAHLGALGILGLFGVATAVVARKKGRDFWTAFMFGFALPIVLGVIAVFAWHFAGGAGAPYYCGGSVCLGVAILVIIGYSLFRRKVARTT